MRVSGCCAGLCTTCDAMVGRMVMKEDGVVIRSDTAEKTRSS